MPSSFVDSVPPIVKTILDVNPASVLDVGPGYGKYGLMCREYLGESLVRLDAVEVPEGRLPSQDVIYDEILEADVRILGDLWSVWELILIIDVIEHMEIEEGLALLRRMLDAGSYVLVSTPKVWEEQHDESNPYETHLSLWSWREFGSLGADIEDYSTIDSIIYLLKP